MRGQSPGKNVKWASVSVTSVGGAAAMTTWAQKGLQTNHAAQADVSLIPKRVLKSAEQKPWPRHAALVVNLPSLHMHCVLELGHWEEASNAQISTRKETGWS